MSSPSLFQFPTFAQLSPELAKRPIKSLKFTLRKKHCEKQIKELENYANKSPFACQFLSRYHGIPYSLIHLFINKQFNRQQRLNALLHNLQQSEHYFSSQLLDKHQLKICQINESLSLVLESNPLCMDEGFWSFSLYNEKAVLLYNTTFAFLPDNALVITSTQGSNKADAKDIMRQLTKQMHGLRPQQFVIWLIQTLAQKLQIKQLYGIAQNQHIKVRGALKKRITIDYDKTWQEYGGKLNPQGYWQLPLESIQKPLSEVAAKKRAMYRRRYELQTQLIADLNQALKNLL